MVEKNVSVYLGIAKNNTQNLEISFVFEKLISFIFTLRLNEIYMNEN